MKKSLKTISVILCLFVMITALVACNEKCTSHVDDNGDLKCDSCSADMTPSGDDNSQVTPCAHADNNLDEKCDKCSADMPLNDGKETYSVSVSDGIGGGYADIIVEFYQNGESVVMKPTNAEGKLYIRLAAGKYSVKLVDTKNRGLLLPQDKEVTASNRNLEVEAALDIELAETRSIMGQNMALFTTSEAFLISGECAYNLSVTPDAITPVVWTAKESGIYTFTFESEVGVKVTLHGIAQYVQVADIIESDDRISDESIKITVKKYNLANPDAGIDENTPYVIGIKANVIAGEGTLKIKKIAEAPKSYEDEPWQINNSTLPGELSVSESKDALTYVKLDGTDRAVYNPADGLYHLNSTDGAVLYVQLKYTPPVLPDATNGTENAFCLESLALNTHFGVTRLDENGELVSKISYHDHILACLEYVNATDENENPVNNAGIYYLTESMIAGLKDYGDYNGWWNANGNNIFGEGLSSINTEYAWMFAVCYIQ